jgi:hypothetical protein
VTFIVKLEPRTGSNPEPSPTEVALPRPFQSPHMRAGPLPVLEVLARTNLLTREFYC